MRLGLGGLINVGTRQQPLIRGLGVRLVNPYRLAPAFVPLPQLESRLEVIRELAPFIGL